MEPALQGLGVVIQIVLSTVAAVIMVMLGKNILDEIESKTNQSYISVIFIIFWAFLIIALNAVLYRIWAL